MLETHSPTSISKKIHMSYERIKFHSDINLFSQTWSCKIYRSAEKEYGCKK